MTEAERDAATAVWFDVHHAELIAWHNRPWQEQAADLDKIEAARVKSGVRAARQMARALGMPMPPDDLCDPVHVLEARAKDDTWLRDAARRVGISEEAIADLGKPLGRVDH